MSVRGCLIATVVLQRSDRIQVNRLPASPHCGEFEELIMVASDRRDVWVRRDKPARSRGCKSHTGKV